MIRHDTNRSGAEALADRMREAYNAHNIGKLVELFGQAGVLRDQAWEEHLTGAEALRNHYKAEFAASHNIQFEEENRYTSGETLVTELIVQGTHDGVWRGLPATGNRFRVTVWSVLTPDSSGSRIEELRIDYDRARLLQQLGLLHDLHTRLGKAVTALSHPMTMAKAAARRISERPPSARA